MDFTHRLPTLPAQLRFRTVSAAVTFLAAVEALLGFRAIVLKVRFTLKLNEQEKKEYLDVTLLAAAAANLGFRTVRCHVPLC